MDYKDLSKQLGVLLAAALVVGFSISMFDIPKAHWAILSFFIILLVNFSVKKGIAYYLEADIKPNFWGLEYYWFGSESKFKKPIIMIWMPLLISFITQASFFWLAVLSYEIKPRTERVSKRHGLYRFARMTDWHIAWITAFGIIANLVLAVVAYLAGFELFARLSIYFVLWSLIPISDLDGSKILFGSRVLWLSLITLLVILFSFGIVIS